MAEKMLKFVSVAQRMPDKRPAEARRQDFSEIYQRFQPAEATEQASRCSQCGVPFCQVHCPLGNNIPDWLKLTAEGRMEEAYEAAQATNTFPEICGRICPQDRLCEGNCVIEKSFDAVTIGSIEKHITENAFEMGWVKPPKPRRERKESIGIVGAGPAGLAAAEMLRRLGYQVTIYDRYDRAGGLMIYGIPNFKLEKGVVERRIRLLVEGGIRFELNCEIGSDISLEGLRNRHDALLLATGVYQAREIEAPGRQLAGIVPAMDYLTASNRKGLGDPVPAFDDGSLNAAGKRIAVIGGGDTAMDCVRTAIRQGARSVQCLYRRDRANMPGSLREVKHAEEEGVEFLWLTGPTGFEGRGGRLTRVKAERMRLGLADAAGRAAPKPIDGSEFALKADLAVLALGFDPEDLPAMFGEPTLGVTRAGTLKIDFRRFETSLTGVFAAGDIVRGASLVVWAIRDGRDAAQAIHRYVTARAMSGVAAAAE
jgi:glutamate synthase (NADPH/NADH) small chain